MFRKLFGETETQQFNYLKPRIILVIICLASLLVGGIGFLLNLRFLTTLGAGIAETLYVVLALMFGWRFLKSLFGFATFGAIFSGNIIFGVIIMILYLLLSLLLGLVVLFLGIGRYIYLLVKRSNQGLEE